MKEDSKMGSFFSYDGVFYSVCEKLFDMLAVSIYWIIGCLPIVTIGASFTALYYTASHSEGKYCRNIRVWQ